MPLIPPVNDSNDPNPRLVSQGAPAWLCAEAKEIFALSQVLQNWSHRSCKKLHWHLAEQLLFLARYCESCYITFGGFLRMKLTAHNKLNVFFEKGGESTEWKPNDHCQVSFHLTTAVADIPRGKPPGQESHSPPGNHQATGARSGRAVSAHGPN